jgi:hypothetical protein
VCASLGSCLALPPWLAFMSRAGPRTKGIPSWAQRSASQVPGDQAFDADDHSLPVGGNGLEKGFGCCLPMPVQEGLALLVKEAPVHGPSVQVDATVKLVWRGVASHGVSSSLVGRLPSASRPRWYAEEGASISIKPLQPTPYSVRSAAAFRRG